MTISGNFNQINNNFDNHSENYIIRLLFVRFLLYISVGQYNFFCGQNRIIISIAAKNSGTAFNSFKYMTS